MGSVLSSEVPQTDIEGYHILHIYEDSPAKDAGLEAFFDFIVAICGFVLGRDQNILMKLLKKNQDSPIELKIFSIKTNTFRDVRIMPNANWEGQGVLGLIINFCAVKDAYSFIHHVLEVQSNSPASKAGLRPFSDYIFGAKTEAETEHDNLDFMTLINKNDQKSINLFVYNEEDNACRSVIIKPDSRWNGNGALGCGIGTGYLHRIPIQMSSSPGLMQTISKKKLPDSATPINTKMGPSGTVFNSAPKINQNSYKIHIEDEEGDGDDEVEDDDGEEEEREEKPMKSMPKISHITQETIA